MSDATTTTDDVSIIKTLLRLQDDAGDMGIDINFSACVASALQNENLPVLRCFADELYDLLEVDVLMRLLKLLPEYARGYFQLACETGVNYFVSLMASVDNDYFEATKSTVYADFLSVLYSLDNASIHAVVDAPDMLVEIGCKFDCMEDFVPLFPTAESLATSFSNYAHCCTRASHLQMLVNYGTNFDKSLSLTRFSVPEETRVTETLFANMYALGYRFTSQRNETYLLVGRRGFSGNELQFLEALHRQKYGTDDKNFALSRRCRLPKNSAVDNHAAVSLRRAQTQLVSGRILEIVVALRELPALVLLHIVDFDNCNIAPLVPPHIKYNLITRCKHFRSIEE